jgi:hypothetical protein
LGCSIPGCLELLLLLLLGSIPLLHHAAWLLHHAA